MIKSLISSLVLFLAFSLVFWEITHACNNYWCFYITLWTLSQTTVSANSTHFILTFARLLIRCMPHSELLSKLNSIGISGRLLSWFRCYLSDRNQLVSINGSHSSVLPVSSGVPQGSILGPLLFLVYINDLPDAISSCSVFLFADDTKCCRPIKSITNCEQLQDCLDKLTSWCDAWNLHFNGSKCVLVSFQKPMKSNIINFEYKVGSSTISVRNSHRDLGVLFQNNLSWSNHYNLICSRAYKVLYLLQRSFSMSNSIFTRRKLYISLIRSQMSYCSQVWRPSQIKDIRMLEGVQCRATTFIVGRNHSDLNYRARLIKLNLLPLTYMYSSWLTSCFWLKHWRINPIGSMFYSLCSCKI